MVSTIPALVINSTRKLWRYFKAPLVREMAKRLSLIELSMLQLEKRTHSRPYFIQVGANDGNSADPFRFLSKNWAGLMIEPQPEPFEKLVKNYASNSLLEFENVAICNESSWLTLYGINLPQNALSSGITSSNKEVIQKQFATGYISTLANQVKTSLPINHEEIIVETKVKAVTLKHLIAARGINSVNALFIDVEGHEYSVLRSFPWEKILPGLVVYEHIHLTESEAAACSHLLKTHGYALIIDGMDTIAIHGQDV
jgi:FkbM family methyltransferase